MKVCVVAFVIQLFSTIQACVYVCVQKLLRVCVRLLRRLCFQFVCFGCVNWLQL